MQVEFRDQLRPEFRLENSITPPVALRSKPSGKSQPVVTLGIWTLLLCYLLLSALSVLVNTHLLHLVLNKIICSTEQRPYHFVLFVQDLEQ